MAPAKLISYVLAGIVFVIALRGIGAVMGPLVAAWRLGPKDQERPAIEVTGWGAACDPAGDCSIGGAGKTLEIDVPGMLHDLSVERAQMTAPRVLRQVEGNFVAEVRVPGRVSPEGDRTSTYALPYHGAGLLVWLDRDNYIRLERAAILRNGKEFHYVNFELRAHANLESSLGRGISDEPVILRLERQGSRVSAAYQEEGRDWVKLPKWVRVRSWGGSLKVGVAAINTATAPFAAKFQDFRVGPGPG